MSAKNAGEAQSLAPSGDCASPSRTELISINSKAWARVFTIPCGLFVTILTPACAQLAILANFIPTF
jgi:hypothetical protein